MVEEHEVGTGLSARRITSGDGTVCLLAIGKMVEAAGKAADRLAERGITTELWDVRSCAPLDETMIAAAATHQLVVTIEDGVRDGGIGTCIADRVSTVKPDVPVVVLGLPTRFLPHGEAHHILARCGLDTDGIERTVLEHLP